MLSEKVKELLINDINEAKTIEDLKFILRHMITYSPSKEEVSYNLAKAIYENIEIEKIGY